MNPIRGVSQSLVDQLVVALARRRWGLRLLSTALLLGCVGGTVERNARPGAAAVTP